MLVTPARIERLLPAFPAVTAIDWAQIEAAIGIEGHSRRNCAQMAFRFFDWINTEHGLRHRASRIRS